jgi:hypothetical protein
MTATLTGTLTAGQWTGNGAGQHAVTFDSASGLRAHFAALTSSPNATVSGAFEDTQQSLTLT